jgi:hypothetical protein
LQFEGDPYPVKLATVVQPGYGSVYDYLSNIYLTQDNYTAASIYNLKNKLNEFVEITVDPSVLESESFGNLDFSGFRKLKFACPDDEARWGYGMLNSKDKIEYILKYDENVYVRLKEQNLKYVFNNLTSDQLDFNHFKLLSLVDNSYTDDIIDSKFASQRIKFDFSSSDKFKDLLLKNKPNRTIILGHIEDGEFITIDKAGNEIFKIGIDELAKFQKENDLRLVLLGCNTGKEGVPGPLSKFTSSSVLDRLGKCENTKTAKEFLDSLSYGTFHFLVDQTFFGGSLVTRRVVYYHPHFVMAAIGLAYQADSAVKVPETTSLQLGPDRVDFSVFKVNSSNKRLGTMAGQIIFLGMNSASTAASVDSTASVSDTSNQNNSAVVPNMDGPHNYIGAYFIGFVLFIIVLAKIFSKKR